MNKKYRLKRNEEIGKIVSMHQAIKSECFIIYFQQNLKNENSRICISVSKKIGNAVCRNKIKRQVREMVRKSFQLQRPYDYVIVIRKNFLFYDFQKNFYQLEETYSKIKHEGVNL